MAYFVFFLKAFYYQKLKRDLIEEKQQQIDIEQQGLQQTKPPLWYRLCHGWHIPKLITPDSFTEFFLTTLFWFLIGTALTYIIFIFVFGHVKPYLLPFATLFMSKLCFMLTFGLAFNRSFRCLVLLVLPELMSKRGRQLLLVYCFALIFLGPTKNILDNVRILSDSLDCSQQQLKDVVQDMVNMVKRPFFVMKKAIEQVVHSLRQGCRKFKEIFITIRNTIMKILDVIKAAFSFLGSVTKICNKKVGTPFERCKQMFESVTNDCYSEFGPLFRWMCSVTHLIKNICYTVKALDYLCDFFSIIDTSIIGVIKNKLKSFVHNVNTLFYARIEFSHSFQFETKQNQSFTKAFNKVLDELQYKSTILMKIFEYFSLIGYVFILFLVYRAIKYRHKFLTNDRYDNRFITNEFIKVDVMRFEMNRDTVLPLNYREKQTYTSLFSLRLSQMEWLKLIKSSIWITIVTIEAVIYISIDYSLFWILNKIHFYGQYTTNVPEAPESVKVNVEGDGTLADLYRTIAKAFNPAENLASKETDVKYCLPNPIAPNFGLYEEIGLILILCWLIVIFEPYGLRMRYFVLAHYYPDRAHERAMWLYNHILRSRSGFLKLARRQLRRNFSIGKTSDMPTLIEIIKFKLENIWIFRKCFRFKKFEACILCGDMKQYGDDTELIHCFTPKCKGLYCLQCYIDLKKKCTICKDPIDYGDISDISEEIDSSDLRISDTDDVKVEHENKKRHSVMRKLSLKEVVDKWKQKLKRKEKCDEEFEDIELTGLLEKSKMTIQESIFDQNEEIREPDVEEITILDNLETVSLSSPKEYVSSGTQTEASDFALSDTSDKYPLIAKSRKKKTKKKTDRYSYINKRKSFQLLKKTKNRTSDSSSNESEKNN